MCLNMFVVIMICSVICCNVRILKVIQNKLRVLDSTGEMRECHIMSVCMCSLHLVLHCQDFQHTETYGTLRYYSGYIEARLFHDLV